ncbi:MAG: PorT family protein [Lewinellaceae bacterium]|nr:PorT family protein [Lewinellaceae bacterium]
MRSQQLLFALAISCVCMSVSYGVRSQVLISLLLGDELNSGQLGYGLNGGLNYSSLTGTEEAKFLRSFYIGTYFDIRLRQKSDLYLHTGVRLKSELGARGIGVYPMNEPYLDSVLTGGSVERTLKYIHIPALVRYKFPNHFFVEIGPMFGLLVRAKDEFFNRMKKDDDLLFQNIVTDQYKWLDAGLEAGIGYHLMKGKGVYLGVRYYQGLLDVLKDNASSPCLNQSIYLFASIPVGTLREAQARRVQKKSKKDTGQ